MPQMKKVMRKFSAIILVLFPAAVFAQRSAISRDTSFTVISTFLKEQKKFPFIKIAAPSIPANISIAENIVYKTIDKRQLHADIFYPTTKGFYPGVILVHGGGWRSGDRTQTIPIAQQLAARGYIAVAVEYRLTPEAIYPASVLDLKTFIKALRVKAKNYYLDPSRIAIMGFSSGGQLAALVGTTNGLKTFEEPHDKLKASDNIQAIIDVDGILAFKHPESEEGAVAAAWLGATYEEDPARWIAASPLSHIDKNTPPALFINSSLPRFHAGRDDMIKKMQAFKTFTEVHTIPDTPHPFWFFDPWFDQVIGFTVGFLDRVFKNETVN